jgi:hypothetical protein
MKYITNNDQELLFESYNNVHINSLIKEAAAQHPHMSHNELVDLLVREGYLEEGIGTQLKSRFAQGVGAVKGFGQKLAGGAQQGVGNLAAKAAGGIQTGMQAFAPTDASGNPMTGGPSKASQWASSQQQAGQAKKDQGQIQGQLAKYQTAINTIVTDVTNDLTKLNMPVNDLDKLKRELFNLLTRSLTQTQTVGKTSDRQFTGSSGATGEIARNY